MPQYLLSVWHDEPYDDLDFTAPETQRMFAQVSEFNATLEKAGGCSAPGCVRPRRRRWSEPVVATSR